MRVILDTDKKTITLPWNYREKLEAYNKMVMDIQRIAAFSVEHIDPPFGVGWLVSRANTGGERQPTEKRKKALERT